jgi:hypothetical protein
LTCTFRTAARRSDSAGNRHRCPSCAGDRNLSSLRFRQRSRARKSPVVDFMSRRSLHKLLANAR